VLWISFSALKLLAAWKLAVTCVCYLSFSIAIVYRLTRVQSNLAASPSCNPSWQEIHRSTTCVAEAYMPAVAGEQCAMYSCIDTLQWLSHVHPQKCPSRGGSRHLSTTWFLGPTWASPQTASRSVQLFTAQLSCVPNTHTHRPHHVQIYSNRLYLCIAYRCATNE